MANQDDINLTEWNIYMPLIGDAGHDAGFRMKNLPRETECIYVTGYDRRATATAILGHVYYVVHGFTHERKNPPATLIVFEWLLRPGPLPRRFREVNIEAIFAARGLRLGILPDEDLTDFDPAVVKVGHTVPLQQSPVT